jgi:hypothetical protein
MLPGIERSEADYHACFHGTEVEGSNLGLLLP